MFRRHDYEFIILAWRFQCAMIDALFLWDDSCRRRLTATHRRPPSFGLASLRHFFFYQTFGLISESKIWCQVDSILDLVWFRILRLFSLMFDLFWDHLGFPGPDSISGNPFLEICCFWDSMLGALGRFGSLETSKWWILMVLGSLRAPFLVTFEGPEAPGHASGGSENASQNRSKNR